MIVGPQKIIFESQFQSLIDQLRRDASRNRIQAVNAHIPIACDGFNWLMMIKKTFSLRLMIFQ